MSLRTEERLNNLWEKAGSPRKEQERGPCLMSLELSNIDIFPSGSAEINQQYPKQLHLPMFSVRLLTNRAVTSGNFELSQSSASMSIVFHQLDAPGNESL